MRREQRGRVRLLSRLAAAATLIGFGAIVTVASPAGAAGKMTIQAPEIVFGPSGSTGIPIPIPFTGTDLISGDARAIVIGNFSATAGQCAPTTANNFSFNSCSSARLELSNARGRLDIPGLTQQAAPNDGIWVAPSGAVLNQKADLLLNILGTPVQINNALATLQVVPNDGYETTDGTPLRMTVKALPGPNNGDAEPADDRDVVIRVEGVNDAPEVTVPSGPFNIEPFPDVYQSSRGDLGDAHDEDFDVDGDEDFDQDELDDKALLVMVATCGEFQLFDTLPYQDDIEQLLTANNMLALPQAVATAIIAVLPAEVKDGTFGTANPVNNWLTGFAGAGSLEEIDDALEQVSFRDLNDDETCDLYTFVTDMGNNGIPFQYVGSPSTGFGIPIPSVQVPLGKTTFVVGKGTIPTATIEQAPSPQTDPTSTSPINFTLTFDTDVTGVTASDIDLSASTAGGTLTATVTGGPAVYDVDVTGMTTAGDVIASVGAGAANAVDAPNNPSAAATSTDNSVTWLDTVGSSVVVDKAAGQADPTSTSPINFTVTFSEPVTGFTDSDVSFSGSTVGGTLAGAVSGGPSTFDVAVTGMTTSGNVQVSVPAGAALDSSSNPSVASTAIDNIVAWQELDTTPPTLTINQAAAQADPTSTSPIRFTVVFSEPVTGFDAADVDLSASTAGGSLGAVVAGGPTTYTVSVSGMTTDGDVIASVLAGAASDGVNSSAASTSTDNVVGWQQTAPPDTTTPTVTINQAAAQSDPTSVAPIQFTVVFSEPVTGFTGTDVSFTASTAGGSLTAAVSGGPTTYTVAVSGMTTTGNVVASLPAGVATDGTNTSAASTSTDNRVRWIAAPADSTPPGVTINQRAGQADPTSTSPVQFTVVFSEAVTGFAAADVDLSTSTAGGPLAAAVSGGPSTYTVSVTGMTTVGDVIARVPAGAAQDAATNQSLASISTDNTVTWQGPPDVTGPTVTINQAGGQGDPTSASPILFTVVFSEPVSGFDGADVDLSASTAGGSLAAAVSGGPSTYTVSVTGMTTVGDVIARVPAGAAQDAATNQSLASISTDNTVTWQGPPDVTGPTVTINQAGGQGDPTSASPVQFTVVFSEPVSGFDGADVVLSGSAGATTAVVSGGPATYTAAVSGMTAAGEVVASIGADAAQDAATNASLASTSTDNAVTYELPVPPDGDTPPTLGQPANITVFNDPGQAGAVVTYPLPTAAGGVPPVTVTCTSPSGAFYPLGVTTVSCTATDSAAEQVSLGLGVEATSPAVTFTITVLDNEPPVIQPKPDITVTGTAAGAIVSFTNPTATDNSGATPTVTCAVASGALYPVGTTVVVCTATDGTGNTASTQFRVIVLNGGGVLPATGGDSTGALRLAALVVAVGAIAVVMVRRRRNAME